MQWQSGSSAEFQFHKSTSLSLRQVLNAKTVSLLDGLKCTTPSVLTQIHFNPPPMLVNQWWYIICMYSIVSAIERQTY